MRVAKKPLSTIAVKQANASIQKKYEPVPRPGDQNYNSFRKDWMDAYIEAGGKYEEQSNSKRAKQTRKKITKNKIESSPGQTKKQCDGKATQVKAPNKSKSNYKDCTCEIKRLDVICEHGRKAKNGLLMVVPDAAFDFDNIKITPQTNGACDGELALSISGESDFPKKTTKTVTFDAKMPLSSITPSSWLPFMKVKPTVRRISATACGSAGQIIDLWVYPNDKLSFKLNLESWEDKLGALKSLLPIDKNKKNPPVKSLATSGERKKKEPKKYCGYIAIEGQWNEEGGGHRAFCEIDLNGGMDPVFGLSGCFPLYGVPVPGKVKKYFKAGIYLNLGVGLTVALHIKWQYWPDIKEYDYAHTDLEVSLKGSVELAAELFVLSEDVVSAKAAGKSSAEGKGIGEFKQDPKIYVQVGWKPLTTTIQFSMAWGLIEYEREWSIFSEIKTNPKQMID